MLVQLFKRYLVFFLYLIASSIALKTFIDKWGLLVGNHRYGFHLMTSFEASQPFVYRVLMPILININVKISEALNLFSEPKPWITNYSWWTQEYFREYLVTYLLLFVFLLAVAYVWRSILKTQQNLSDIYVDLPPFIAMLLLPLTFSGGGFLYDFPDIFFISLAFLLFIKSQYIFYYMTLCLAVLNKESSILMAIWFIPTFFEKKKYSKILFHFAIHALVGIPIFLLMRWLFSDNPGRSSEFNLWINIEYFLEFKWVIKHENIYADSIYSPSPLSIPWTFLLLGLVLTGWKLTSPRIRSIFLWSFFTIFLLFIFFGWKNEIRVFNLVVPSLIILIANTFQRLYSVRCFGETVCHNDS